MRSSRRIAPRRRHPSWLPYSVGFVVTATALSTVARDWGRAVRTYNRSRFKHIACAATSIHTFSQKTGRLWEPLQRSQLALLSILLFRFISTHHVKYYLLDEQKGTSLLIAIENSSERPPLRQRTRVQRDNEIRAHDDNTFVYWSGIRR